MEKKNLSVTEAIRTRRSIKKFNGQLVEREMIMEILDLAAWAPNHQNRQPWRVVLATGQEIHKVVEFIRDLTIPMWQSLSEEELAKKLVKFTTPGAYAFVIVPEDLRQKERLEDYAAASSFLQNIQLIAWDYGIGTCWKTPAWLDKPETIKTLNVKSGERIIAMLQFGYFDEILPEKDRKLAEKFVTNFGA